MASRFWKRSATRRERRRPCAWEGKKERRHAGSSSHRRIDDRYWRSEAVSTISLTLDPSPNGRGKCSLLPPGEGLGMRDNLAGRFFEIRSSANRWRRSVVIRHESRV